MQIIILIVSLTCFFFFFLTFIFPSKKSLFGDFDIGWLWRTSNSRKEAGERPCLHWTLLPFILVQNSLGREVGKDELIQAKLPVVLWVGILTRFQLSMAGKLDRQLKRQQKPLWDKGQTEVLLSAGRELTKVEMDKHAIWSNSCFLSGA